jgi:hypothetical protein
MPKTCPTLAIHLKGGIVHQIVSSVPFPAGWDLCVIDQDNEAEDPFRAPQSRSSALPRNSPASSTRRSPVNSAQTRTDDSRYIPDSILIRCTTNPRTDQRNHTP